MPGTYRRGVTDIYGPLAYVLAEGYTMDRDDAIGVAEAALVGFGAYVLLVVLLLSALATYPPALLLLLVSFSAAATVVLSCFFLPTFSLAMSTVDAERVLSHAAYELRRRGLRVEETPGLATVRLGSSTAVRIRVQPSSRGSRISYQAYATPTGWGTLITLIVLVWGAPASLGAILYVFRKARNFARGVVVPLVREAESAPHPPEDEVRTMLLSGLSEGHRLASEAYEALHSSYMDAAALVGVTAGLVGGVVFVVLLLVPPFAGDWIGAAAVGIAGGVLTGVALYAGLRRTTGRRLRLLRLWSNRLREALTQEAALAESTAPEACSVELLLQASEQIPTWLQAKRQAGLSADQAADWVVFALSLAAFWTGWAAVTQLISPAPPFLAVVLELAATPVLGVSAYLLWRHWKRKRDEALARTRAEWRQRIDALQAKLDGFLQDL